MQRDLTDVWLRSVKPPESGRLEIWDTRVTGLVLRITPRGGATWCIRMRTASGKRTRPKIGSWPAMGITEARKQARATTVKIETGGDPVSAKRVLEAERKAQATLPTVAERLAAWKETKAFAWSIRYQQEVDRVCKTEIVPTLGKRPLSATTREDWTSLIAAKHKQAPGVGSMLYRTAASFLNHAEAHGWIAVPMLPRKGLAVIAPPVAARERTLTDVELRKVWKATDELKAKARAFVRILVMTAAREMEVADIATGEIDLEKGTWFIPGSRTKNGCGIVLPVPPILVVDLKAVWPVHGGAAGPHWRLLGDISGNGLRGFSKLKARLDKASGVTDWRWHDLRRTARTGMTRLGVPRDHAEAAINHISGRTQLERTYDRHDYADEVIAALSKWQGHILSLVAKPDAEIVIVRRRA
jgi:integrase